MNLTHETMYNIIASMCDGDQQAQRRDVCGSDILANRMKVRQLAEWYIQDQMAEVNVAQAEIQRMCALLEG
jgi:hypothetical protein